MRHFIGIVPLLFTARAHPHAGSHEDMSLIEHVVHWNLTHLEDVFLVSVALTLVVLGTYVYLRVSKARARERK